MSNFPKARVPPKPHHVADLRIDPKTNKPLAVVLEDGRTLALSRITYRSDGKMTHVTLELLAPITINGQPAQEAFAQMQAVEQPRIVVPARNAGSVILGADGAPVRR